MGRKKILNRNVKKTGHTRPEAQDGRNRKRAGTAKTDEQQRTRAESPNQMFVRKE